MSVYNYIQGVEDNTNARYNFLIQGGSTYTSSLGLMLKDDVTSASTNKKGSRVSHDNSNNAFFDLRTDKASDKTISMRMIDDSNPTAAPVSMLTVTDDDKTNASRYGATVTGRVKASQYFVGEADTRTPSTAGVYLGMDASTTGYFKVNKGASGTGGFKFTTYNADGSLAQTNLELNADGTVKATKYSATNNALDTESRAFATVDANGQLVRDYGQNARLRSVEDRVTSLEEDTGSVVPAKVNEIITRMNSLYFFSSNIDSLVIASAPTPYSPYTPTSAPTTAAPTSAPTTAAPVLTLASGYNMDELDWSMGGGTMGTYHGGAGPISLAYTNTGFVSFVDFSNSVLPSSYAPGAKFYITLWIKSSFNATDQTVNFSYIDISTNAETNLLQSYQSIGPTETSFTVSFPVDKKFRVKFSSSGSSTSLITNVSLSYSS